MTLSASQSGAETKANKTGNASVSYDRNGTIGSINELIQRFVADENGQDLLEYALLAGLVGTVSAALFPNMQAQLKPLFTGWENSVRDLWIPKAPST